MNDFFLIAKIVSIYEKPSIGQGKSPPGSAGEGFVKIFSYSDFPERFVDLQKVYLEFYDEKKEFCIEKVEKIKDYFLLKFKISTPIMKLQCLSVKKFMLIMII